MKPRTRATLFIGKWVTIFCGGFAVMIWMWDAAHVNPLVPAAMAVCWGNGVGKLVVADRDRILRKIQRRTEQQ